MYKKLNQFEKKITGLKNINWFKKIWTKKKIESQHIFYKNMNKF